MPNDVHRLTARERAVLGLVAQGLTNRAIARRLGVRPATVKRFIESIYLKIGVQDRVSATLCGLALDLIPPPSPEQAPPIDAPIPPLPEP